MLSNILRGKRERLRQRIPELGAQAAESKLVVWELSSGMFKRPEWEELRSVDCGAVGIHRTGASDGTLGRSGNEDENFKNNILDK